MDHSRPYHVIDTSRYTLVQIDIQNSLHNYNYLLHCKQTSTTLAIDPTDANITTAMLTSLNWTLDGILSTHHHADHIGGNEALHKNYQCNIYGNAADSMRIAAITHTLDANTNIRLGSFDINVIDVSGHTIGHVAYYIDEVGLLFVGDALFSAGCGRLFEGTAEQMHDTIQRIAITCRPETLICCAHEYTHDNMRFALSVEPDNAALQQRMRDVINLREANHPTVPTTLAMELSYNPFMRCHIPDIKQAMNCSTLNDAGCFGALRAAKDIFS